MFSSSDHLTGLVGERVFYLVRDMSEKVQNYQQISCVQTKDSQESSSNSYSHSSDGERSMSDTSMISEASFSLGQYGCVFVRMYTVAISYNTKTEKTQPRQSTELIAKELTIPVFHYTLWFRCCHGRRLQRHSLETDRTTQGSRLKC